MVSHHFMSVTLGMDYIWQGWIIPQTTAWPHTTHGTYPDVALVTGTKSLNHGPHQWCSGPRIMTLEWICHPTIWWVLYGSKTMSDRGRSPHRPPHDYKLYPRHAQILPWILKLGTWTMLHISSVVIVNQGWWYLYGHAIPLLYECYMRQEPRLTGLDQQTDHDMTLNYTPDMLSCYPGYWNQQIEDPRTSSVV